MNGTVSATCATYRAIGGHFDTMPSTSTSLECLTVRFLKLTLQSKVMFQMVVHAAKVHPELLVTTLCTSTSWEMRLAVRFLELTLWRP